MVICSCKCHLSEKERLDKLEKQYEGDYEELYRKHVEIRSLAANFENMVKVNVENIFEKIFSLEKKSNGKIPHKCPVCNGECLHTYHPEERSNHKGLIVTLQCKVCEGKGVLWN